MWREISVRFFSRAYEVTDYRGTTDVIVILNYEHILVEITVAVWPCICRCFPSNSDKSRSSIIGCYNDLIALNFDRHLCSAAAEVPVKCQSDGKRINPNRAIFSGKTSVRLVNWGFGLGSPPTKPPDSLSGQCQKACIVRQPPPR